MTSDICGPRGPLLNDEAVAWAVSQIADATNEQRAERFRAIGLSLHQAIKVARPESSPARRLAWYRRAMATIAAKALIEQRRREMLPTAGNA